MKLLLHICCAPCLIYPLERLRAENFEVIGFFYNPNIHPFSEYNNRRKAVEDFSRAIKLEVIYPEYNPAQYFQVVNFKEDDSSRCPICWELRLRQTALAAKEKGWGYFSTTLLASPYQDQGLLQGIAEHIEEEENVNFYYEDFRPGFRQAHQEAKARGIYCQKYCGCLYSMKPRLTQR